MKQRLWINAALFAATVVTTIIAGAFQNDAHALNSLSGILAGIPFSISLLGILVAHEMGHYLTSVHYRVTASLPYFIPFVPYPPLPGTMGAIIRMRSVVRDRRILFDIGIAGPFAGIIVAIPVTVVGLLHSRVIDIPTAQGGISLGDSLLFLAMTDWIFGPLSETQTVLLHPVAYAGWLGLFITSLNLIPLSQLDGGHVAYGALGQRQRRLARLMFLGLLCWGVHGAFAAFDPIQWIWAIGFCLAGLRIAFSSRPWPWLRYLMVVMLGIGIVGTFVPGTLIWLFWATLIVFMRLDHPPTFDVYGPLDRKRNFLAWMALAVFILCFVPRPFAIDL